jgi:hypothetical protein
VAIQNLQARLEQLHIRILDPMPRRRPFFPRFAHPSLFSHFNLCLVLVCVQLHSSIHSYLLDSVFLHGLTRQHGSAFFRGIQCPHLSDSGRFPVRRCPAVVPRCCNFGYLHVGTASSAFSLLGDSEASSRPTFLQATALRLVCYCPFALLLASLP